MALGTDSVIAFWEKSETYDHRLLADHAKLRANDKLIMLAVFHVTDEDPANSGNPDPIAPPGLTRFFSLTINASMLQDENKFIVRGFDSPNIMALNNAFIRDVTFKLDDDLKVSSQILDDLPPLGAIVGVERASRYLDFFNPAYAALLQRAKDVSITLFESDPALNVPY